MPSFGDFARQHPVLAIAAPAIGAGVGTHLAITRLLPGAKGRRKQMKEERRDPRLWSNLKGMLTGKSREERVAAHKHLGKGDGTILGAMREGFKSQEKTAMLAGLFDELDKIALATPPPGTLTKNIKPLPILQPERYSEKALVEQGRQAPAFKAKEPPKPPPPSIQSVVTKVNKA